MHGRCHQKTCPVPFHIWWGFCPELIFGALSTRFGLWYRPLNRFRGVWQGPSSDRFDCRFFFVGHETHRSTALMSFGDATSEVHHLTTASTQICVSLLSVWDGPQKTVGRALFDYAGSLDRPSMFFALDWGSRYFGLCIFYCFGKNQEISGSWKFYSQDFAIVFWPSGWEGLACGVLS